MGDEVHEDDQHGDDVAGGDDDGRGRLDHMGQSQHKQVKLKQLKQSKNPTYGDALACKSQRRQLLISMF